jgi:hypothetical protein
MRGLRFTAVLIALSPLYAQVQNYTEATTAAWCVGALGAYAGPSETGATYLTMLDRGTLLLHSLSFAV